MPLTASSWSRPIRITGRGFSSSYRMEIPGGEAPYIFGKALLAGPLPRLTAIEPILAGFHPRKPRKPRSCRASSGLWSKARGEGGRKRFLKSFEKLEDDEGGVKVNC